MGTQTAQATAGQIKELASNLVQAIPTDTLTSQQAQSLIGNQDYLREWLQFILASNVWNGVSTESLRVNDVLKLVQEARGSQTEANPYAGEKVKASLFYPRGWKPASVETQVKLLIERLGTLDEKSINSLLAKVYNVDKADGLFVVPKPSVLARMLQIEDPFGTGWGELTERGPLVALADQRAFRNWRQGKLTPDRFRLSPSARTALEALEAEQPGDFLVFAAQTGKLWGGYSPRNSRWKIEHASNPAQWPLPAYCLAWILFTNLTRLGKDEHLAIDCPGDEFQAKARDEFVDCPTFYWDGGKLYFRTRWVEYPHGLFGSASASR